jgi:ABC-type transporter Mla MlaB component
MKARPKPGARKSAAKKSAAARRPAPAVKKSAATPKSVQKSGKASKAAPARTTRAPVAVVGADCTIEHAPALHAQLAKLLSERACVTVDVAAVKRCDTAGLQVLAAFVRERRETHQPFELKGATEAFVGPATLLGLGALFGLEAVSGSVS